MQSFSQTQAGRPWALMFAGLASLSLSCGGKGGSDEIPPNWVSLTPTVVSLKPGNEANFTATLMGPGSIGANLKISWKIQEGATGGGITGWGENRNTGVYAAPASISGASATFHVIAFSEANPTLSASATVTVQP